VGTARSIAANMQRRLTRVEVEELVAGATIETLSVEFGIHRTTVMAHLRRAGIPGRPRSRSWTARDLEIEAGRYLAGESLANIAARYSISPSTVGRRLQRAGVEFRPRPGW